MTGIMQIPPLLLAVVWEMSTCSTLVSQEEGGGKKDLERAAEIKPQCSKLKFFRSHLLATSFCKMVATRKILVAKKQSIFKAGHLMLPYMK